MLDYEDERSKRFAFVPFCALSPAFRARGIVRSSENAMASVIKELMDGGVNVIQLPCVESQLCGYEVGLSRGPAGMRTYDKPDFRELCGKEADKVVDMIKGILENGYEICVILGVENSPTCAVSYQYARAGLIEGKGIFIAILDEKLKKEGIEIPFVGIDNGCVDKALEKVREVLGEKGFVKGDIKKKGGKVEEKKSVGNFDSEIEGW